MIQYSSQPNPLLEALAYLGRRTAGNSMDALLDRLSRRGITELKDFSRRIAPLKDLMKKLDAAIPADPETLRPLFGDLPNMPRSTVGSYSPAFLLFYPMCSQFDGDLDGTIRAIRALPSGKLAYLLAVGLEIAEDEDSWELPYPEFSARVLSMQIPPEAKVSILDLLHDPASRLEKARPFLEKALEVISEEAPQLEDLCMNFGRELQAMGAAAFLSRTSGLSASSSYLLRPFLFGLDTNLSAFSLAGGENTVYCGIFRMALQDLLAKKDTPSEDVYEAIRLLADRTRFDILCYLRDRTAYGQELSEHFGLSRNTIHHHMAKLLSVHLVRCTMDGNRVYYTTNREAVTALLEHQKALLLKE